MSYYIPHDATETWHSQIKKKTTTKLRNHVASVLTLEPLVENCKLLTFLTVSSVLSHVIGSFRTFLTALWRFLGSLHSLTTARGQIPPTCWGRGSPVPDASPGTAVGSRLLGASWNFHLNRVIFAGKNIRGPVFSESLDETVHWRLCATF